MNEFRMLPCSLLVLSSVCCLKCRAPLAILYQFSEACVMFDKRQDAEGKPSLLLHYGSFRSPHCSFITVHLEVIQDQWAVFTSVFKIDSMYL